MDDDPLPPGKRPGDPSVLTELDVHPGLGPRPGRAARDSGTGWPDLVVGEYATRQHGLITRAQLKVLGVRRGTIDDALARRRLNPVHRGVYAVGHMALRVHARELAAVLAIGDGTVLSHHSAAILWGLAPPSNEAVEVTVIGRDAGRRRSGIHVHSAQELDERDVTVRHRIPITTPARTLLDRAPFLTARELERSFDEALTRRLCTRHEVVAMLERNPRRKGAGRLAELAGAELRSSTVTRSETEERLVKLIRRGGLPTPRMNARVGRFTVDFIWTEPRLIVEVDGYEFHSTHRAFEHDHARDLDLGAAGFQVMRFTWHQIVDQPELVLTRLTQRLTELTAQSGRSSRVVS